MDSLMKEIEIRSMFYENADIKAMNDLFIESAPFMEDGEGEKTSNIKKIGLMIKETIQKIIDKFKEFIESIKRRFEAHKVNQELANIRKYETAIIKGEIHDKEVLAIVTKELKIHEKAVKQINALYVKFMDKKIDYETYNRKVDEITVAEEKALEKLDDQYRDVKVFDRSSNSGNYKASVVGERFSKVYNEQVKVVNKINDDVEKTCREIEKAARAKKANTPNEATAAAKASTATTASGRKTVTAIITTLGVVAGIYNISHALGNRSKARTESVDIDDIFDDIFEESYDDYDSIYDDDDIFDDIF